MSTKMSEEAKVFNYKMAVYLEKTRDDERLTMQAVADKLEKPHSFIGKIENQHRRLDVGEFVHYCQAIKQDPVMVLARLMIM